MENTKSGDRRLLIAILIISSITLLAALTLAIVFVAAVFVDTPTSDSSAADTVTLPDDLASMEDRMRVFEEVRSSYNSGDNDQLLSTFGKPYEMQLRASDFDQTMISIRNVSSTIGEGAYKYFEYDEIGGGLVQYRLFYDFESPAGLMELILSFYQQGDDPSSMSGLNVNTRD